MQSGYESAKAQSGELAGGGGIAGLWRRNSLSIVVLALFVLFLAGQAVAGWLTFNETRIDHRQEPVAFGAYLLSSHFAEATSENWESEFLQMGLFVLLTVFLRQKGSAESNPMPEEEEAQKKEEASAAPATPVQQPGKQSAKQSAKPAPLKRGGWRRRLYEHSLSLAFFLLFSLAFIAHAISGFFLENSERETHNLPPQGFGAFIASSQFWFQSFQNWQSEFLAVGSIVLLSIWLRERGSSQSKPVDAPHDKTGG
jgi:hypothetical protein